MLVLVLAACAGEPACAELPAACTPEYGPTWEAVHANTVSTSCQLSGCHGEGSAEGGLALGDSADRALTVLLDDGWVLPEDPACSPALVEIMAGTMPPGTPLSEAEACAVQTWIERGANP